MHARIIACYNLKGGVGKTTAAVNLAYAASRARRVLLWDLDPQGAASYFFRIRPKVKGGVKKLLSGKRKLADFIKATNFENLDLMPADFSYRNLDLYLRKKKKTRERLAQLLEPVRGDYDYVILDSPPGISLMHENIFQAAEALVVPLIPTFLSLRVYEKLKTYFDKHGWTAVQLLPFLSMVDRRRSLHRDMVGQFARDHAESLRTWIGYASMVELMGRYRAPLQTFAQASEPAQAFDTLWKEVTSRLGELRLVSSQPRGSVARPPAKKEDAGDREGASEQRTPQGK